MMQLFTTTAHMESRKQNWVLDVVINPLNGHEPPYKAWGGAVALRLKGRISKMYLSRMWGPSFLMGLLFPHTPHPYTCKPYI